MISRLSVTLSVIVAVLSSGLALAPQAGASTPPVPTAEPGTNLLLNPDGTAGATSAQGWDAVTIPGWQVREGLPTVVKYGTPGFPKAAATWPASRGDLFAGGAGGTARLVQVVPLKATGNLRYSISAWLGGTKTSDAGLTVRFLTTNGKLRGTAAIGPAGRQARPVLARRTAAGAVPPGTARAQVILTLATTLTNANGPNAPQAGYDYATAAGLSLTLSQPTEKPRPLTPPHPQVPRYQHVFLFYFENYDYNQVIGSKQAPYLNSLRRQGALLSQFYAEEHPSDANYLALAGGSAFGVPLTDPEEENPLYTINARNIGDLIDARHETWKAYTQSANGPCDDTVHGYYWNDDQPMLYFADVRDRPSYCASHVVPLEELQADLATPATTPNFAWIAPDDCSDMEGCGLAAGDAFLKTKLTTIMRSPAWRTQRSLAIITFDEDAQDYQRPAQRVPTIILASQGVRPGGTDSTRYTHYSLLRTIEAALCLGTLTANDRYAQAVTGIFYPERDRVSAPAPTPLSGRPPARPRATTPAPARPALVAAPNQPVAWVANYGSDTVTPVNLATREPGAAVPVGAAPRAVTATRTTVYVANSGGDTVTPVNARTGRPGKPIVTGSAPWAMAVTPDGKTLYVANSAAGTVTPVSTATGKPGRPIRVGEAPRAIVITPDGRTAYVLDWLSGTVTPIAVATGRALPPIPAGAFPVAAVLGPGGKTLYVANFGADTVTPVDTAANKPGRPIPAGYAPDALAATKDGVYAVDGDTDRLTRLGSTKTIAVGYSPSAIAAAGGTAYVVNTIDGTVTPVDTRTGHAGRALSVGLYSYPTAIATAGSLAVVLDTYGGQVSLINLATRHVYPAINAGGYPSAVAITG
ncbi:MAG TPA: alkaline phosphatase family protein [Trebonia sp.]|nr:alkaline phosphatase family protein [Trebonia sp.]